MNDATIYAFRRNVVVAASAGTGKTHRLTALYLLLALGLTSMDRSDDRTAAPAIAPDRIVATTFSRAAAAEIKKRVERALTEIARGDVEAELPFADAFAIRFDALGESLSRAELRRRAEAALTKFTSARIDTLHGVAGRIVRAHALALGMAPGARVLEEEEADGLAELAIGGALGEALAAGGDREAAARALIAAGGGIVRTRVQIQRLLDRLDEEGVGASELAIFDHHAEARALADRLRAVARESASFGAAAFRAPASALARALDEGGAALLPEGAEKLVEDLFEIRLPSKKTAADEALAAFIDSSPVKGNKSERAAGIAAALREGPRLGAREEAMLAVIDDARAKLDAEKRKAGALGFGDLLRGARDVLRDDLELAAGTRASFDALLVDEFQDTSRVQKDLVYLLREREDSERVAGEVPSAKQLAGAGLFLVGDRKQSIYGFRGADVAIFARTCAELAGDDAARALSLPGAHDREAVADFVALQTSRRSGKPVLDFVNAFSAFDFASDAKTESPRAFEIRYGPGEVLAAHDDRSEGEVVLVEDDGTTPEHVPPIVREAAGPAREAHVAAAFIASEVRKAARASFRDFAVLARRRSTIPLVELALARLEVPYVVAGRALYEAIEVRDLAALLRLLLDPKDRLALAVVLRGPIVALSDPALALLSAPKRGLFVPLTRRSFREDDPVDDALLDDADRRRLDAFRARFLDARRALLRLGAGDAVRAAIRAFDLDRVLAALPRAEARIGNLDRLAGIARERGGTLSGFSRWLDRRIREEADEAEAAVFSPEDDAVRLTTIHASKGLDFPIVVLVDLNASPRPEAAGITFTDEPRGLPTLALKHWPRFDDRPIGLATTALKLAQDAANARELAERKRLTYVAITRARTTLALVAPAQASRGGSAFRSLEAAREHEPKVREAIARVVTAADLLDAARVTEAPTIAPLPARPALASVAPERTRLSIATTPLAMFADCPRRFRFRHLLSLDEPVASSQLDLFQASAPAIETIDDLPRAEEDEGDARALGRAAHRVLERWPEAAWGERTNADLVRERLVIEGLSPDDPETARTAAKLARFLGGAWAREIARAPKHREVPFVLAAGRDRALAIRGAIDLLIERADGTIEILDYKLSRPRDDLSPYRFQLATYALAARRRFRDRPIEVGLLFLGARDRPISPGDLDLDAFERELEALADRFAAARRDDRWEGVEIDRCKELHCGFVEVCHRKELTAT